MRRLTFIIPLFIAFLFGSLFASGAAYSAGYELSSSTILQLRENADDDKFVPIYEYLNLAVNGGRVNFYSAAWLRYDLRSKRESDRERDELTYAYLTYEPLANRRLLFSAGRHLVFGGVASEQIDGISARWEITPATGVSVYGGVPVETEEDSRRGDLIYGGRISQKFDKMAEIGLSVLQEENESDSFRREYGLDLWAFPFRWLELQGFSSYNAITEGWMETSVTGRLFPVEKLTLTASFSRTDYDDAFSSATISPFSPEFLGKDEELTKFGGSAEYVFGNRVTLTADYANYEYETMKSADYYGMGLAAPLLGARTGLSAHRMEGSVDGLRYWETRAYALQKFNRVKIIFDAINIHYDKEFSGLDNSYALNGTVSYEFADSVTCTFNLDYEKSPDYDHELLGFLKLAWAWKK